MYHKSIHNVLNQATATYMRDTMNAKVTATEYLV